ncbi:MAG TPA: aldo/keto reductase [Thermotogota bacterium]|nr:aldo/keto reductase [Thermotogota bacterium]HRW92006.1 aldo/keto reductase [Thermotogota bacterium]
MDKLCLGTAQFGMRYGVNNPGRKPSREEVFEMLDFARLEGIMLFDTAPAYGNAEELLGEYVRLRGLDTSFPVTTKLKPGVLEESPGNARHVVVTEAQQSLKRMNLKQLEGYYLHTPGYLYHDDVMEGLQQIKESGLAKHVGVSVYEVADALFAADSGILDLIQLPYSIFDQRIDQGDFFERAGKNNVVVHARSAFLQGLLVMDREKIPQHLQGARVFLQQLDALLEKSGVNRVQACMLFSLTHPGIDALVFGVDSLPQLQQYVRVAKDPPRCPELLEELHARFQHMDRKIILPNLWEPNPKGEKNGGKKA